MQGHGVSQTLTKALPWDENKSEVATLSMSFVSHNETTALDNFDLFLPL